MKKYRVKDIIGNFGLFLDEEYEGENSYEVLIEIAMQISENIGNYIDIELEEVEEDEEYEN
jgi:hypothetical protein